MNNFLANQTLSYIWNHPNCQSHRISSIAKFVGWQLYKRLTKRYLDIKLVPSIKLRCHPDSCSASAALYCGLYDYNEMNFLLHYLRPEDSFLDVGANIGAYTLLAASIIRSGFVYSVEVLPKNYDRLQENIQLNHLKQVKTYSTAISDQTGKILINLCDRDSMAFITQTEGEHTISVATDTLDRLLAEELIDNLMLAKMDIEGAELLALQGATSLLKRQRPPVWILEINSTMRHLKITEKDVVSFLKSYGYGLYQYDANLNRLQAIASNEKSGNNVLAIADSALDFVRDRLTSFSKPI
jgi:FkbM family methyltransferase